MQKIKFYNSGLNHAPCFYQQFKTDILLDGDQYADYINYNYDLMKTRYIDLELKNLEEEQIKQLIEDDLFEDIHAYDTLFTPCVFNEEIALDCGLIPFIRKGEFGINLPLLALGDSGYMFNGDNILVKLDAYQALAHDTLDQQSRFFNRSYEDHCKKVLGNEVYNKVMKVIGNEVIW